MAFESKHRYARISPRKVRPLADLVRGKFVDEALDILRYQPQRGARMLEKVIRTALANAQDPDQNPGQIVDEHNLFISQVCVDPGPMFKRDPATCSRDVVHDQEANVAHPRGNRRSLIRFNTSVAVWVVRNQTTVVKYWI